MLNSKEILRKRIHIVIPICIAIGTYFPTLLITIFSGEKQFKNPAALFRTLLTSHSAWRYSVLLSVVLMLGGFYLIIQTWRHQLYQDKLGKKRTFSLDYQPYGDAHWAEPCEYSHIAKIRPLSECKGTVLGQLTLDGSQCVDMFKPPRINKHVLAIGSSGAGKSFSLVEPYIMQAVKQRHSIVVTDPKGELFYDTAGYLEDHGYIVRRLDLITLVKSDGWDCLKYLKTLHGDELETNAQILATVIVTNTDGGSVGGVYLHGSIALLKALILYTVMNTAYLSSERNIRKINELLHQKNEESFLKEIFIEKCPLYLKPAQNAYLTFQTASTNLHGNIIANLAANIQILQTSSVETILSTDEIDLTLPGDVPCAYFCRFSATDNTFRFVSAMFFSMLFISLIDHADSCENKKLKVPVDFIMDEFPSIGKIPDWLEKISNIRSYGITAVMIVQGMSQIRGIYGDDAVMIIGNCGTVVNIGMNDVETARWFQDRIGSTSIVVSTEQIEDAGSAIERKGVFGRESRGVGRDYLISASDIFNMDIDDEIIVFQHCNPVFAHKVPITLFEDFKNARKISDEQLPDLGDKKGRKLKRLEEQQRIAQYNAAHPYKEAEETEEYEEPVDFSQMGTLALLKMIVDTDLKALLKKYNAYRAKHGKAPIKIVRFSLKKEKETKSDEKEQDEKAQAKEAKPQGISSMLIPFADVFMDDDLLEENEPDKDDKPVTAGCTEDVSASETGNKPAAVEPDGNTAESNKAESSDSERPRSGTRPTRGKNAPKPAVKMTPVDAESGLTIESDESWKEEETAHKESKVNPTSGKGKTKQARTIPPKSDESAV